MVEPKLDPKVIFNETDLLAAAIHIDRYVMVAMDRLGEDFTELNSLAMQTFKQLSSNKHVLNDKILSDRVAPGDEVTRNLEEITAYNEQMEARADTAKARLQRLCACCERSAIFYDAIVEMVTDENILSAANELAGSAHDRLDILKRALGKECGCCDSDL